MKFLSELFGTKNTAKPKEPITAIAEPDIPDNLHFSKSGLPSYWCAAETVDPQLKLRPQRAPTLDGVRDSRHTDSGETLAEILHTLDTDLHEENLLKQLRKAGINSVDEHGTPPPSASPTEEGYFNEVAALIRQHIDPGFRLTPGVIIDIKTLQQAGQEPYQLVNAIATQYKAKIYSHMTPALYGSLYSQPFPRVSKIPLNLDALILGDQQRMLRTLYSEQKQQLEKPAPAYNIIDFADWKTVVSALSEKYLRLTLDELVQAPDRMERAYRADVHPYAYLNKIIEENELALSITPAFGQKVGLSVAMQNQTMVEYWASEEQKNSNIAEYLIKKDAELVVDNDPALG